MVHLQRAERPGLGQPANTGRASRVRRAKSSIDANAQPARASTIRSRVRLGQPVEHPQAETKGEVGVRDWGLGIRD